MSLISRFRATVDNVRAHNDATNDLERICREEREHTDRVEAAQQRAVATEKNVPWIFR